MVHRYVSVSMGTGPARVRVNSMLDEEIVVFLKLMKTSKQKTREESGYSGFLEDQVWKSEAFVRRPRERRRKP